MDKIRGKYCYRLWPGYQYGNLGWIKKPFFLITKIRHQRGESRGEELWGLPLRAAGALKLCFGGMFRPVFRRCGPSLVVVACFGAFVWYNGGVAVGDR